MNDRQETGNPRDARSSEKKVYSVLHKAFKTEYVVAESKEAAWEAAAGGWDTGDYAYGEATDAPHELFPVERLAEMQRVGDTTVERLLNADSAVSLAPASQTDELPKHDITRVRNRLEDPCENPH